ncbi:Zn(II)2Cys6 transcription factor [Aspergillus tubingensis]|uniref:Zn(II)2Cys6 transcription factor n=1 Tax=Aspergillus tubingensis TaxID=5068 RepID=UPI001579ADAB|nr:Zn(II)2Cys6 transcription factor [Aspergillus tubingensis]GFN19622.1 Zn(II)2Cys6 transcription factor [Aspergillus tubingensis]GLA96269.1 hypothetical protein AtubIFM57143_003734 [Aspergillus tubingensis]
MESNGVTKPTWVSKPTHQPKRRHRIPLSCDPCRARKLKCNREKPCQNCITRNEQPSCRFRGSNNGAPPIRRDGGDEMKNRIDHLEGLVKRLIAERQNGLSENAPHTPESSTPDDNKVLQGAHSHASEVACAGTTMIDGTRSVYRGGDEWYDVLEEINALKQTWTESQDEPAYEVVRSAPSHIADGSSLLFGQVKPLERIEIISTLPPKHQVDKLIALFFDTEKFQISVPPILHKPTFMREYNEHWKDPSRTNFIWLGLLFSILGLTMLSFHQFGEPPEYEGISESLFQLYRIRTAQCLLNGDIAKCLPYTIETLRFNATAELNRKDDNRRGLWIMTGVIVRAAINMGYHRDPSHSPSISPFQAEYRRRVWMSVIIMDDMASFLGGFPRTSSTLFSDTMEPRNIHDWELTEETTYLPPSRPLEEPTATTYIIAKTRLFRAIGRIADFNNTPTLVTYDTVREIDQALYDAYEHFPSHLKVHMEGNIIPLGNAAEVSRFSLCSMYHRAMCTLHRKFMAKGRLDNRFKLSHDRCLSSAMTLLDYQVALEPSWYKSSLTRQVLTLAAMILFLELELARRFNSPDASRSIDILQILERSCDLWRRAKDSYEEAGRVYDIIVRMIASFRPESATTSAHALDLQGFSSLITAFDGVDQSLEKETLDIDIDWTTWDAFIQDTELQDGPIY